MGDVSQAATALLTEHLQYTPLSLIDDIINSVNNLVYQGISSLENGLTATPPARLGYKALRATPTSGDDGDADVECPEAKQEIEEGLHQLETLLESTVDKNFDKFEIYVLRNILSVPEELAAWIRLSHYENLSYPPPQRAPTQESIHLLRRKIAESQRLRSHLLAEASRNEAIIEQLKGLLTPQKVLEASHTSKSSQPDFSFLTSNTSAKAYNMSMSASTKQTLTTNTNFALSQLPALQSLLADLRPKLASLQTTAMGAQSVKAERREERREYIEQRARIHLQRNGEGAAVNDPAISGKRVEPEEVEALEKVADMFDAH